ncbi:MAG: hypothetical protein COB88_06520 [Flavobacteriales bacterium]|nr:MAG: hypothetical protein COB88_06520 [Flavobacteriales bacterium]
MHSVNRIYSILLPIILLFLGGCDSIFQDNISEGYIEFEITYPETDAGDLMAGILPNEMILRFKDDRTVGSLSAGMGVFKTQLMAFPETKTVFQLVKLMNKKYALRVDSGEIENLYSELPAMKIHLVDSTKMVAGYECKKAIVTFKDNIKEEFSIYYTDEIGLDNSNWCTPFHEIKGVLLEYQVRKYNYEMRLTAIGVVKEKIDESYFVVPEDYEEIDQDGMDKIFEGFKEI